MKFTACILLLFFILSIPAYCDIAPIRGIGSTIVPIKNDQVMMLSQDVTIRVIDSQKSRFKPIRDLLVEAHFILKNTGPETELEMGFPFPTPSKNNPYYQKPWGFNVLLNGKRTKLSDKQHKDGNYTLWYTWSAKIPEKEILAVTVRYRFSPSQPYTESWYDPYHYSRYLLSTGKYWKGPIGNAKIYMDYNPNEVDIYRASPVGYIKSYGKFEWSWINLEPTQDIVFEMWGKNMFSSFFHKKKNDITKQEIKSSSTLAPIKDYAPVNAFDGDKTTAWVEGAGGYGKGEWLSFNLSEKNKQGKSRLFYLEKFGIRNGYTKSEDLFRKNNRVKTAIIEFSDGTRKKIELKDMGEIQWFDVSPPVITGHFKLIIQSVYQGSNYNDTCISDIFFRGTYSPSGRNENEDN
ncbi:MAG: discoidin domain-containing protein [Candidatus Eremiobacteraeota bacterium]|nr:discoidin domain-containing protein [Candidatus Eremiobacteraeota bacterium]